MSFDLSHDDNPELTQGVTVILTLAELDHIDRWDRVRQRAQNIINHLDAAIDQHEVLNAS